MSGQLPPYRLSFVEDQPESLPRNISATKCSYLELVWSTYHG
jgi:hypothetical protein